MLLISRKSPLIQVYHTRSIAEKEMKEYTESHKIDELYEFRMIQAVIERLVPLFICTYDNVNNYT